VCSSLTRKRRAAAKRLTERATKVARRAGAARSIVPLDTNALARCLAQDDAQQAAIATQLIEKRLGVGERGYVSLVALLETVWVKESRCAADAALVCDILADLLQAPTLELQDVPAVRAALAVFRRGGVDLHDCPFVALAAQRQARVVTFDAKAAKKLGMEPLRR
jgi:predicted nucleic-acid-binding protein